MTKEIESPDTFKFWLERSKKGDTCLYYTGFLMRDKELFLRETHHAREFPAAIKAAQAAMLAYEKDLVTLYQSKKDMLHYEYYAEKR